nr:hypothetical protein [Klebsiella variicola]
MNSAVKIFMSMTAFLMCGCVDLGRVGMHPEVEASYFEGHKYAVETCLYSASLKQHFTMVTDDPLPGGIDRFNIQDKNNEDVAWLDVSRSGNKQTSVNFYYAPHAPDVHNAIMSMINECKNSIY